MKTLCMWLGFAIAAIAHHFVGREMFPTPADGSYPLERAIGAFVIGGGGALIGGLVGRLLDGASGDRA